jgi:hypothetical protein
MSDTLRILYRDPDRFPYLALMRRCARQRGVELELERWAFGPAMTRTGEEWGDLLEREEVDVIAENYWGLQTYRARGVPFLTLASASNTWTEKLYVDPSITRVSDLAGTRMALRGVGPQTLFPVMWLADVGLAGQVDAVLFPESETGRWGHWKKVADGTCQSCFMTPLYAPAAAAAGLVELQYQPYSFDGGHVTLTTTEHLAAAKRSQIQTLIDAAFDASELFADGAAAVRETIRSECADLLSEHFPAVPDEAELTRIEDVIRAELAPVPVPTAEGIATAHRMRLRQAPELASFNPLTMWDLSFARRAVQERNMPAESEARPGRR